MEISQLLSVESVVCNVSVSSKKRALEAASNLLAETCDSDISDIDIFDGLIAREKLGSTGLGHGVAIPHGRFNDITDVVAVFIKFEQGIDFDAIDGASVDLVFALMVPQESTEEHLQLLASLAEMFGDAGVRERLRQSSSSAEILEVFKGGSSSGQQVSSS